ncbi:hypothetical protein OG943_38335 [Amycolatopsis sp. NBC_00345]|uniref:hypothetical protein n=1 Tax=Amycolatopsis sp. NBC_00345 TaxID=2975955 RepID=UPI002E258FBA
MTQGMHMDTGGTTGAMSSLASADAAVEQAWSSARGQIDGIGGQLGQGPLGQAFMAGYRPAVTQIDQTVQTTVTAGMKLAQAGRQSIADYVRADNQAASSFTMLGH